MSEITRRELMRAGIAAALAAQMGSMDRNDPANARPALLERQRLIFNRDFRFLIGDHAGAEKPGYDDSSWGDIGIPHCFSTPYWGAPQFYVGYGWYRKQFTVDQSLHDKKLFLEFEGAFQDAEIFINGVAAGRHKGGYTGFVVDVSPFVTSGENLLAVRLNNLWDAETAPRAGEHQFAGGIYRNVWLLIVSDVFIPFAGISVTTPKVGNQSATVNAKIQVANSSAKLRSCAVRTVVLGPDGKLVAQAQSACALAAGATTTTDITLPSFSNPKLWHPDHPYLYTLKTTVLEHGVAIDNMATTFGIRTFEFTADGGFFLNGEHCLIRGCNVHQDHAGWCNAVTNAGFERDIAMVKEAGFNFVRGSHYPHSPAFYDACDRRGILVWSELCFWGMGGNQGDGYWSASAYPPRAENAAGFEASCIATLREMVTQHRNNASVVVWSMCNEVFFSDKSVMPAVRDLLTKLVAETHRLDPTRPAGIGGCQRGELDKLGDIAGYNGDGARLFINPGIPSVVTEYGSCGDGRPGDYDPCYGDTTRQPDFPWRAGKALWCMFDHGSIANIGFLGCVDYFRLPKRRWYWYRNAYGNVPAPVWPSPGLAAGLSLEASSSVIKGDGTDDCQIIVRVVDSAGAHISDSPPVTLKIDSGPGSFPTGAEIPFLKASQIPIVDGVAAIEFRSYHAGQTVIRATSPGLSDAKITVTTTNAPAFVAAKHRPLPVILLAPVSLSAVQPVAAKTGTNGNLALNRPTKASSEERKNPANGGCDGDLGTRWCAIDGSLPAWWEVDLENVDTIQTVKITFERAGNYRYKLEISTDEATWTTAVDQTNTTNADQVRTNTFPPDSKGRFLRITYTGLPPASYASHRELEVYGRQGSDRQ